MKHKDESNENETISETKQKLATSLDITYEMGAILMRLQLVPLGLVVQYMMSQVNDHLANEVVGPIAHIIPQRDLWIDKVEFGYYTVGSVNTMTTQKIT